MSPLPSSARVRKASVRTRWSQGPSSERPWSRRPSELAPLSRRGEPQRVATGGARSDRGWGKAPMLSNQRRERRVSETCPAPDLENLRQLPATSGRPLVGKRAVVPSMRCCPASERPTESRAEERSQTRLQEGCSKGPPSCSWRQPPAEVVTSARGPCPTARAASDRGLAGVESNTGENVRHPAPAGQLAQSGAQPLERDTRGLPRRKAPGFLARQRH